MNPFYKIIDSPNKVKLEVANIPNIPSRIVFKSMLVQIRPTEDFNEVVISFSGGRMIIDYNDIDPTQREELGINSTIELIDYLDSITNV